MSGGQQNKDEEIVKMVARMNELKEKQDPGSTKKEKEGKKDSRRCWNPGDGRGKLRGM